MEYGINCGYMDISFMFKDCSSLKRLPDISKWNTSYIILMNHLFDGCSSLEYLPDISKWDINYVEDINFMFYSCSSLKSLPDISKWNFKYIKNLNSIFENCSSLSFIPDISKWKLNNNIKINNIFKGCDSLLIYPNISKWNINISETSDISSSSYNFIKTLKTNTLLSEDIEYSNLSDNLNEVKNYCNYIKLNEDSIFNDNSNNELNDFYENFYN